MKTTSYLFVSFVITFQLYAFRLVAQPYWDSMNEQYRPNVHFSPKEKWINDPNGMVFYKGIYHLFFQYYPDSTVWGPMHWGHAVSTDLVHWKQKGIALYPDSLGYIFSGSAVVDYNNSSGFAKNGAVPLVAVFTHHNPTGEKAHKNNFQNQSLAYSLDEGATWVKYAGNPVLKNPGIKDFRDPKVMWYEPTKKWIMTLATNDHVTFFSSPNLKDWTQESEFGSKAGAHGGVWECPDLFTLEANGKKAWVLIVSVNPGGPNKGSGTQYFIGNFNGHQFMPYSTKTKWLDYGPDNYAGITWSNTSKRTIFIGWMSNWLYAQQVPTVKWRNALTIPRELKLMTLGKETFISAVPVKELNKIKTTSIIKNDLDVDKKLGLFNKVGGFKTPCVLQLSLETIKSFSLVLLNEKKEHLVIGYDKKMNRYFINRDSSGKVDFNTDFASKSTAPRLANKRTISLSIVLDQSSAELFADDGATVMTSIFFPAVPYNRLYLCTDEMARFKKVVYTPLTSIWP